MESQKIIDKERENFKLRVHELEFKAKEADSKRSALIFEFEKERAKWALERDHLINQKNDAVEMIQRLERKKENLLKENQKLVARKVSQLKKYGMADLGIASQSVDAHPLHAIRQSQAAPRFSQGIDRSIGSSSKKYD